MMSMGILLSITSFTAGRIGTSRDANPSQKWDFISLPPNLETCQPSNRRALVSFHGSWVNGGWRGNIHAFRGLFFVLSLPNVPAPKLHHYMADSFLLSPSASPPTTRRGACFLGTIPHLKALLLGLVVKFGCVNFYQKMEITFPFDGAKLPTPSFS